MEDYLKDITMDIDFQARDIYNYCVENRPIDEYNEMLNYLTDITGNILFHGTGTYTFKLKDVTYDQVQENYVFAYEYVRLSKTPKWMRGVLHAILRMKIYDKLKQYGMRIPTSVTLKIIQNERTVN